MRLTSSSRLTLKPLGGTWYRVIPPQYYEYGLDTRRTKGRRSRFSPGTRSSSPFEILYLSENRTVALHEVEAEFTLSDGRVISNPNKPLLTMDVKVTLQSTADLVALSQQRILSTNAQELTGDWIWYDERTSHMSVPEPQGIAPTQQLGEHLFCKPFVEGFQVISARMPCHRNLVIFPEKLLAGSAIEYCDPISNKVKRLGG